MKELNDIASSLASFASSGETTPEPSLVTITLKTTCPHLSPNKDQPDPAHTMSLKSVPTRQRADSESVGIARSHSVSSAFEPRKESWTRSSLRDVVSPSSVSVRVAASEATLSGSESVTTLSQVSMATISRPRSLVFEDQRAVSHSDALEAIAEPQLTPTQATDNNNANRRQFTTPKRPAEPQSPQEDKLSELPKIKKLFFAFSPESRRRQQTAVTRSPRLTIKHNRRHSTGNIGQPSRFRHIGRLIASSPTSQPLPAGAREVELLRPPEGPYGFYIALTRHSDASQASRRLVVSRITNSRQKKLLAGILAEGDEIVEVNGCSVRDGRCSLQDVQQTRMQSNRLHLITIPLLERHDW